MVTDGELPKRIEQTLPFQQVQHQVTSTDCHPTINGGILVHVCGNLVVRREHVCERVTAALLLLPPFHRLADGIRREKRDATTPMGE